VLGEGRARGGSPERWRPAERGFGGGGRSSQPDWGSRRSEKASVRQEWAVICGAVEVAELDLGHGREGDVV
jgi:hypothetical protein